MSRRSPLLPGILGLIPNLVYVMCGARGERANRLVQAIPQARFVGFEADPLEFQHLNEKANARCTYFNVAAGRREETRTFYITRNPACASLLKPNTAFFERFQDCGPAVEVCEQRTIHTVSLDSFLPARGIQDIDFLEVDTQGSELEILQGAERLLGSTVVGLKVEVEFSPIYEDQPLFADLDPYVRNFGFMLFDLSRNRYRRNGASQVATRGQLLWGDAIYLMDWRKLPEASRREKALKLCVVAAALKFHDYALEILDALRQGTVTSLSDQETRAVTRAQQEYRTALARKARWQGLSARIGLERICFGATRTGKWSWSD